VPYRVLISDKLANEGLKVLEGVSEVQAEHRPGLDPSELLKIIPEYDGLIIRSATKVTAELLAAAKKLRVIGRAGIGVDNVDLQAATASGVIVMNTPEGNAITTAEHAISLMTSLARQIPQATASMRAGQWEKNRFNGKELYSQTLGVVGLGNIGSIVADRARGLQMRVIAFDPLVTEDRAQQLGVELVDFDELLERADIITLHVPRTKETENLLGAAQFARMKKGVLIVNAARGGIVNEAALLQAIESGKVAGAALDVFAEEPPPKDHPLLKRDEVIATPHLGAATAQAQLNVAIAVAEQVRDYFRSGIVRNAVNLPSVSAQEVAELRPFMVLGEKLGLFAGQICDGMQEIEVEYAGEVADLNVQPITLSVLKGVLLRWVGSGVNLVNAPHVAQQRGIRVVESKAAQPEDFVSRVCVRVRTGDAERVVAGTLFGRTQPRVVAVNEFALEAVPEGPSLLILNRDEPGVVGHVGMTLAKAGINISRMQLALRSKKGEALQLLNLGSVPDDATLDALRALSAVLRVDLLDLGPAASES
jgi:D-3-phosphoglycerate dehydrogenase / 2-oxoglutarate reductase